MTEDEKRATAAYWVAIGIALAILFLIARIADAYAQQTRVFGPDGRSQGTVSTDSQGTKRFRDERGNTLGTATTRGNTTTFYDERGRVIGRSSK